MCMQVWNLRIDQNRPRGMLAIYSLAYLKRSPKYAALIAVSRRKHKAPERNVILLRLTQAFTASDVTGIANNSRLTGAATICCPIPLVHR